MEDELEAQAAFLDAHPDLNRITDLLNANKAMILDGCEFGLVPFGSRFLDLHDYGSDTDVVLVAKGTGETQYRVLGERIGALQVEDLSLKFIQNERGFSIVKLKGTSHGDIDLPLLLPDLKNDPQTLSVMDNLHITMRMKRILLSMNPAKFELVKEIVKVLKKMLKRTCLSDCVFQKAIPSFFVVSFVVKVLADIPLTSLKDGLQYLYESRSVTRICFSDRPCKCSALNALKIDKKELHVHGMYVHCEQKLEGTVRSMMTALFELAHEYKEVIQKHSIAPTLGVIRTKNVGVYRYDQCCQDCQVNLEVPVQYATIVWPYSLKKIAVFSSSQDQVLDKLKEFVGDCCKEKVKRVEILGSIEKDEELAEKIKDIVHKMCADGAQSIEAVSLEVMKEINIDKANVMGILLNRMIACDGIHRRWNIRKSDGLITKG